MAKAENCTCEGHAHVGKNECGWAYWHGKPTSRVNHRTVCLCKYPSNPLIKKMKFSKVKRKKWKKHIVKEGAIYHVIHYDAQGSHCSDPDCEINKPIEVPDEEVRK